MIRYVWSGWRTETFSTRIVGWWTAHIRDKHFYSPVRDPRIPRYSIRSIGGAYNTYGSSSAQLGNPTEVSDVSEYNPGEQLDVLSGAFTLEEYVRRTECMLPEPRDWPSESDLNYVFAVEKQAAFERLEAHVAMVPFMESLPTADEAAIQNTAQKAAYLQQIAVAHQIATEYGVGALDMLKKRMLADLKK